MVKKRLSEAAKARVKAARMFKAGKTPVQVMHELQLSRATAYRWKTVFDEGGLQGLRALPERGRPRQLGPAQLRALARALLKSPTQHGFGTELWTLKRVGVLIQRLCGVKYGQTQVWRILGELGFSAQKPERRAIERDEQAAQTWLHKSWPALKKKPAGKGG